MSETPRSKSNPKEALKEVRYSLRVLLDEVREEREGSTLGQEIVDQKEIGSLFNRKPKAPRGRKRE